VPGALLLNAVVLLLALGCGCSLLHETARLPGRAVRSVTGKGKQTGAFDPVVLQQRLMRFADDYSGRLEVAMDRLPSATNSADAIALLQLRLNCVDSIYAVATGPNELMNLADMFVLVTLARAIVQEQWLPGAYGESARPMLEACRQGETNITAIALTVVSPQQLNELRAAIAQWRQEHSDLRGALFARGLGLEVELAARRQNTAPASESLLSLLRLDPLAGLDPAAHELAQTRLFGERTLFLAQRKPTLLRWQTELLILETAATPPLSEVRTNTTKVAAALERASKTVAELPALVRSEREAILHALPSHESALTNLAAQLTTTLEAGTRMSEALNTTLTTVRGMQETATPASGRKRERADATPKPSSIEDYTESVRQVELAAQQLTELLRTLNQTLEPTNLARLSGQLSPVVEQAQAGGRAVADYAFRRAILLVAFTCFSVLATALAFHWLRKRASPP
jgi:hypothetical protein